MTLHLTVSLKNTRLLRHLAQPMEDKVVREVKSQTWANNHHSVGTYEPKQNFICPMYWFTEQIYLRTKTTFLLRPFFGPMVVFEERIDCIIILTSSYICRYIYLIILNISFQALDHMYAERIGHGYHALDDPELYQRIIKEQVHLETCPISSILTKACDKDEQKHPLKQ